MVRMENLAMKTPEATAANLVNSDLNEFVAAVNKLVTDAAMLGGDQGFTTSFFQWAAAFAAIYLLILDRTNWKTKILTPILVPYIYFTLPLVIFNFLSGDFGRFLAINLLAMRLARPENFPECLEIPAAVNLLLVIAPEFLSVTVKDHWIGALICLFIAFYISCEHLSAFGKESFTEIPGISNTLGIILLMLYPLCFFLFQLL